MLDVRSPSNAQLSPDGKQLFFTWAVTEVAQVWRLDGPGRFPVQLTGGDDPTELVDVAPDGSFLVVSRDRNGEENPGLYLLRPGGGALEPIQHVAKARAIFQAISDDSKFVYFRANDVKADAYVLYRTEVATRRREVVFEQEGLWSLAGLQKNGHLVLSKMVGHHLDEVFDLDPATKALTPLFGQGEREGYSVDLGARDELLVLTAKLGEFRRLYRWRAGSLEPVTPELKADVERFLVDPTRTRITTQVNEGGFTRLKAFDAKTFKPLPVPALPSADHVRAGESTPDGRYQVVRLDLGTTPNVTLVLDWKKGTATPWLEASLPELDPAQFVRPALEHYPARDGTPIPMFVWRPKACAAPCPVVVNFHGGPELQSRAGFNELAQLFVGEGFVYVEPNVRGSDGFGKAWLHSDDGPKRLAVITDIEDASRHIRAAWAKDGKAPRVGIMGESYGGYAAMLGLTMFAGAYDAVVEMVGPSNLVSFLENTAPYRRAMRISEYGDPVKDRDALLQLSPVTYVSRAQAPLLMMQGANDPRVPVSEALQMLKALEPKGQPNQLYVFPDEGHVMQRHSNKALLYGHAVRWFETHLKAP
ncbi:MAG: prolyl oligopeptidase family serine peptidase [Myxococcaceae bacterium]|nr:prolyl oligopeptidase family serine peptidase [Myxococcaceae bacterium]